MNQTIEPSPKPIPEAPAPPGAPRSRPAVGGARWIGRTLPLVPALIPAAILVAIVVSFAQGSGLRNFGSSFWGFNWNEATGQYGIMVFVVGSFLTAVPALLLAMVFGLGIAIASTTYLPRIVSRVLDPFVDLLAGIPSIVYGIWGYWIVAPYFGSVVNPAIASRIGFLPGFHGPVISSGQGLPIAIFLLLLMVLPITTLLIRDTLRAVPRDLWESGLALGATRWEVVRRVALPYGSRGIWSAVLLGFGRAIGETVAVAMVIGTSAGLPGSAFGVTSTIAAFLLENQDAAFADPNVLAALAELALLLLAITLIVNLFGRRLVTLARPSETA